MGEATTRQHISKSGSFAQHSTFDTTIQRLSSLSLASSLPRSRQTLVFLSCVASLSPFPYSAGILTGVARKTMGDLSGDGGGVIVNARCVALPIYAKTSSSPPLSLLSLFVHFRLAHSLLALDEERRQARDARHALNVHYVHVLTPVCLHGWRLAMMRPLFRSVPDSRACLSFFLVP